MNIINHVIHHTKCIHKQVLPHIYNNTVLCFKWWEMIKIQTMLVVIEVKERKYYKGIEEEKQHRI
jgi:hypothetical protein